MNISPCVTVIVENQPHSETTNSYGSRWPRSLTQLKLKFHRGSKVTGNQEMSSWCQGLTHAACRTRRKICIFLVSSNPCKTTTEEPLPSTKVLLKFQVHGNPRRPQEEAGTSKNDAVGGSHFHSCANYTIFGPMGEDVKDLNWFML